MKYCHLPVSVFLIFVCTSIHASPQSPSQAKTSANYYMAIKGGISLGSYESGLNDTLLTYIHEREETGSQLVSFSGASAGSINSLLSAVRHCNRSFSNDDSFMEKTWDIGITQLLGDGKDTEAGLFTRKALETKVKDIEDVISAGGASKECNLVITMSLTRFIPEVFKLPGSGQEINIQRFVVPIKVEVNADGKIIFKNFVIVPESKKITDSKVAQLIPGPYIRLPEENGEISFTRIKNVALASSAFPVAFRPLDIEYCPTLKFNDKGELIPCTTDNDISRVFSDGGLFDNSPIGVVRDLMHANIHDAWPLYKKHPDKVMFFINPDHYRPVSSRVTPEPSNGKGSNKSDNIKKTGLGDYAAYFYKSFNTATSAEFINALIGFELDSENDNIDIKPLVTSRFHNLTADFHAHFGAFYSADFRAHDYLVGIYDGFNTIARDMCGKEPEEQCITDEMNRRISVYAKNTGDPKRKAFLQYLASTETDLLYADKNTGQNIYIALASSFNSPGKNEADRLAKETKKKNQTLDEFIDNLKKTVSQSSGASIDVATQALIDDYQGWRSDSYRAAFRNMQKFQERSADCAGCEYVNFNKAIGSVLNISEPVASSIFTYSESGVWPLAINYNRLSFGLLGGYDYVEHAVLLSPVFRFRLASECTLDLGVHGHIASSDRDDDNYGSISAGLAHHFNSVLVTSIGYGFDYTSQSDHYTSNLTGVYASAGSLGDLMTFKLLYRPAGVTESEEKYRKDFNFSLHFDLTKIAKMFFF